MNAREAATFMRAFGDPTRLRILNVLSARELSVGELTVLLECPVHRISRHLRYLHARRLVDWHTDGNTVVYSLVTPRHSLHQRALAAVQQCLAGVNEIRDDNAKLVRMGGQAPQRGG
jgi:DNA-binding transcriptional ArsR family regulator